MSKVYIIFCLYFKSSLTKISPASISDNVKKETSSIFNQSMKDDKLLTKNVADVEQAFSDICLSSNKENISKNKNLREKKS